MADRGADIVWRAVIPISGSESTYTFRGSTVKKMATDRSLDAKQYSPLIVCGPPRCGTRFVANVLDAVPEVMLHGELQPRMFRQFVKLVKRAENMDRASTDTTWPEVWHRQKQAFMFSAWASLNKNRKRKMFPKVAYLGHKTPYHEHYFDFYNSFFAPVRPVYVCCVRSFTEHFLSVKTRWPNKPIHYIANHYISSLSQIRRMRRQRPDEVKVFVLDDYKREGFPYLRRQVISPLGISAEAAAQTADKGRANSAGKFGLARANDLSWAEQMYVRMRPSLFSEYEALREEGSERHSE